MQGFTILELLIVAAIISVASAIAVPAYDVYIARAHRASVLVDFGEVQRAVDRYQFENWRYPDTLVEIGMDELRDPWDQPYQYLRIDGGDEDMIHDFARQDRDLKPINTDYDLYSVGPDGESRRQLTANESQDDVVRAQNGVYFGYAEDY
jgi:general secretion pathway protein G